MSARSGIRPAWTIAQRLWLDGRWGFCAIMGAAVLWALMVRMLAAVFQPSPFLFAGTIVVMGGALFLTFVLCGFTEADRRERHSGFPARLFVLPVSTQTLIGAPILFGIVMVSVIYLVWATVAWPALGRARELPLGPPLGFLAAGMTCYHALIWSLARYRVLRLLALSVAGTIFAVGWIDFAATDPAWRAALLNGVSVRLLIGTVLGGLSVTALVVAYFAVDAQRHGGRAGSAGGGRLLERMMDALPRSRRRFAAPAHAQFWLEWRRHGVLLPLCTAGALVVIMLPAPFAAPISAGATLFILKWMVVIPIAVAFALGQGLGKPDLWSKEAGLPLFLATRPLPDTEWIAAKMKTAAVATVAAWSIVAVLVPLWLWQWCDCRLLVKLWREAERMYSPLVLSALPVLALGILLIVTWRCLVANLFIGLAGRAWLLTVAACNVFVAVSAVPAGIALAVQSPEVVRWLFDWPEWSPWLLAALWVGKIAAAALIAMFARRRGWIAGRTIVRYAAVWCAATAFLLAAGGWLLPVSGWHRGLAVVLTLFVVPLLRAAYAPVALAQNRHR